MSGTSVDAIDVAIVDLAKPHKPILLDDTQVLWKPNLQKKLLAINPLSRLTLQEILMLAYDVTQSFAHAIELSLKHAHLSPNHIQAIGCHGQTIAHCPTHHVSWQLCLGSHLAVMTGIDVIADFRAKDLALQGQGAPLASAFHAWLWGKSKQCRCVINLGGLANITVLDGSGRACLGFDTGPANTLLDAWYRRHHRQGAFDQDGVFARQGRVNAMLLDQLLSHPYFQAPAPKSLDRQVFSLPWLDSVLSAFDLKPADVQATLVELTVVSLAQAVKALQQPAGEIWLCGGGAYNSFLVQRLTAMLPKWSLQSTQAIGLSPQRVESVAFAWLAYMFCQRQPVALSTVTGASKDGVLGVYYPSS